MFVLEDRVEVVWICSRVWTQWKKIMMNNLLKLIDEQLLLLRNLQRTTEEFQSKSNITRSYAQSVL